MSGLWKQIMRSWASRDWIRNATGLALATSVHQVMRTLEYKTALYEHDVDPAFVPPENARFLYVFWHEYIPYYLYLRGYCGISMLLSSSRDGDIVSRTAHHMGFQTVRGSTKANPVRALRGMLRSGVLRHLTMTPDGPRGPRRRFSVGAIYISSKLQMPIIPLGLGYDRPWRLNSWDRFAVPRPYSRARCVAGPPIQIPRNLSRKHLEHYRQSIETLMNRLTLEAESWAAAGTPKLHELATKRQPWRPTNSSNLVTSDSSVLCIRPTLRASA